MQMIPSVTDPNKLDLYELDPNGRPDRLTASTVALPTITWTLTMGGALGPQMGDQFVRYVTIDGGDGTELTAM